ncbi:tail fiber protein [Synechococcus phage DSL-LC03]|nr:tail fiber protein [Synechococcus phage DSL-LC03]
MPLSRLENFLKNVEGNIIYVNPADLDSTDAIENQGNSQARPFKTIQRALIEAARFSYNIGVENDKFDRTSILLMPGTYVVDNRPGFSIVNSSGTASFRDINGEVQTVLQLTNNSNFDIEDPDNDLYKFNSTEGGIIVPRGTSIVGLDLRKTKIRPKYVPDPYNASINPSAIFKVTGGCYFWQFSFFDGDINSSVYYNNTKSLKAPTFSHHKLACFEYADGVNGVGIGTSSGLTDLQMYYYKLTRAYGASSGRDIQDFPTGEDFQPSSPEFKIVGAVSANDIGISSAVSVSANPLTVTVNTDIAHGLSKDDIIRISGFSSSIYNGSWIVTGIGSDRQFDINIGAIPPTSGVVLNGGEKLIIEPDNVNGASPYIFNCSMRSVYGMSGLHGDGSKSTGFKSIVVAQFTGISLQRDDNAFVIYNRNTGTYQDNDTAINAGISSVPLHLNSQAIYKPEYESYHVKTSNSSFIQAVSIFSIGFSQHFLAESGGDISITNSNSNFGARSLVAKGFQEQSFDRDDVGYITHIIPPKDLPNDPDTKTWLSLNVGLTTNAPGITTTNRVYLYGSTSVDNPPPHIVDSFSIGAKQDEILYVNVATATSEVALSAPILMPIPDGTDGPTSEKSFKVIRVGAANSITSGNTLNFETPHTLFTGESVRVLADDGLTPDGLITNNIYYAITGGALSSNQIQLSKSLNDAISGTPVPIDIYNTGGGLLRVVSRVNDKSPNDIGHPIQYDSANSNWYVTTSSSTSKNTIRSGFTTYRQFLITGESSKSFITRKIDTRSVNDRIYRFRYVIPKEYSVAREPSLNYIIQETKSSGVENSSEFTLVDNQIKKRNHKIISNVSYDSINNLVTVTTELPHKFMVGDKVTLQNVRSTDNTTGASNSGYNGINSVTSVLNSKQFQYSVDLSLGTFIDNLSTRNEGLPYVYRQEYKNTFYIYTIEKLETHEYNKTDGVYHLTCLTSNVSPSDTFFNGYNFSQSPSNLYPTLDRDNFNSDPVQSITNAKNDLLGKVVINSRQNSITKETVATFLRNNRIGIAITDAKNNAGITSIFTEVEHNFNSVKSLSIVSAGANYGYSGIATVLYNAKLIGIGITGEGATANVSVSAAGTINGVTVVDGGSAYGVGMTMTVIGVTTQASWSPAVVSVSAINNNIGDAIEIVGVGTTGNRTNSGYNGLYRISGITSSKIFTYDNGGNPGIYTGTTNVSGYARLTDEVGVATGIQYSDTTTGIVTVFTSNPHGLQSGEKFTIVGAAQTVYNGTYLVKNRLHVNSFNFYIGAGFTNPSFTGSCFVLSGATSSKGADTAIADEKIGGRMVPFYAGISTTTSTGITTSGTTITLGNIVGFNTGDFLQIDNEVIRISGSINTSTNTANIIRGTLGTKAEPHDTNSLIRKINVIPTELRRHSILRASGHTFEYVGFGHGNYAAALPSRQNRILTREEQFLTQSVLSDGGTAAYTGTNDSGDFYIGNKIISPINNTEISINVPTETYLGVNDSSLSVTYDDITINNSLKVTGGIGNFQSSEFRGPVSLYKKLTSTATDGIEAIKLELKGNATQVRSYTVGISTPSTVVTQGDVVYNSTPEVGKFLGWTYTGAATGWKRFGLVSQQANSTVITPDQIGIGTAQPQDLLQITGGGAIFDQLRVTGIVTFDNGGSVNRISLGDVQNVGFTTFLSGSGLQVLTGAGASFAGITTFGGVVGTRVAITTNTYLNVAGVSTFTGNVRMGNLEVDTINIVFPDGFTGTASNTKNIITAGVSTNSSHYLPFVSSSTGVDQATGGEKLFVDPGVSYNPSTNKLTLTGDIQSNSTFIGNLANTLTLNTSGTGISGSTTFNNSAAATFTVTSNATSNNTNDTIVSRNGLGGFVAGIVTATTFIGNLTGTVTGSVNSVSSSVDYLSTINQITSGISTFSGSANNINQTAGTAALNRLTVAGITTFTGNVSAASSLAVTGATTLQSSLAVTGATNLNGNVTLGDASADLITISGTINSAVLPTSNTYNLGGLSNLWLNVYANTFHGAFNGNASTATTLQTARNINGVSFNGSGDITITANTTNTLTKGSYLTGSNFNGSAATTWAVDADTAATGSKIVARDPNGYVFAAYFNAPDGDTASVGRILVKNGSDNYYRSATAATIASFLSGQSMNISGSSTSCSGNSATSSQVYVNTGNNSSTFYLLGATSTGAYNSVYGDSDFYFTGSNTLYATNMTVGSTLTINSDISLKTNIEPLEGSLAKILSLRGVEYDRVDREKHQIGLIAQEVEEVLPEIVSETDKGLKTVEYTSIIPILIEAIKELKAEIDELKKTK